MFWKYCIVENALCEGEKLTKAENPAIIFHNEEKIVYAIDDYNRIKSIYEILQKNNTHQLFSVIKIEEIGLKTILQQCTFLNIMNSAEPAKRRKVIKLAEKAIKTKNATDLNNLEKILIENENEYCLEVPF